MHPFRAGHLDQTEKILSAQEEGQCVRSSLTLVGALEVQPGLGEARNRTKRVRQERKAGYEKYDDVPSKCCGTQKSH